MSANVLAVFGDVDLHLPALRFTSVPRECLLLSICRQTLKHILGSLGNRRKGRSEEFLPQLKGNPVVFYVCHYVFFTSSISPFHILLELPEECNRLDEIQEALEIPPASERILAES